MISLIRIAHSAVRRSTRPPTVRPSLNAGITIVSRESISERNAPRPRDLSQPRPPKKPNVHRNLFSQQVLKVDNAALRARRLGAKRAGRIPQLSMAHHEEPWRRSGCFIASAPDVKVTRTTDRRSDILTNVKLTPWLVRTPIGSTFVYARPSALVIAHLFAAHSPRAVIIPVRTQ